MAEARRVRYTCESLREPVAARPFSLLGIVSCGQRGAGDQVFVQFVSARTIRFGIDRWGAGATYSQTVLCDYSLPHVLIVSLGALYPDETVPIFQEHPHWAILRHVSLIVFDGVVILKEPMECHPALRQSVAFFNDLVGLTSSIAAFQGRILSLSPASPRYLLPNCEQTSQFSR